MTIEILASGSSGNVAAVRSDGQLILIDCGKAYRWTIERLNHELPDALLVTHEHGDHSHAVKDFLKRGVEVYMTRGTADFLGIERHNLNLIIAGNELTISGVKVEVIESIHDAAEPVNFILQDADDRVLFLTDTGALPDVSGDFTKIFIEANYSEEVLLNAKLDLRQKWRILENHLSLEQAEEFLAQYPRAEVSLIHRSTRHSEEEKS
ncbi:MAG: MBL fold metallo-hydrolase [Selenomonadaceae bacterium]|nr:MBL fold metallo-hydrolase [Selenomonadaceae bacterium]